MFDTENYELIDFGAGRRLERFGGWVLDRPCPAAERFGKVLPARWDEVDARFDRDETNGGDKGWTLYSDMPKAWTIEHESFRMELQRSPVGHLGVFPEQASNWDWIARQVRNAAETTHNALEPIKILNLFAYTGGSTLAAAAAGIKVGTAVEVVHVDAAANIVKRGKRNAKLSDLQKATIRWIAEDAMKFVGRELTRGNYYDAVILDPPSYGHGRKGEVWRIGKHLPKLLEMCGTLTAGRRCFLLLTCHTPGLDEKLLSKMLRESIDTSSAQITTGPLGIEASSGQTLPAGVCVRLTTNPT